MNPISYLDAGVDIDKGDRFVEYIKQKKQSMYRDKVISGVGGFASIYKATADKFLAVGTDGVGTKLKIAKTLGIHSSIGIDLVAMNVNDIICSGAEPSFFMDYLSYSDLDEHVLHEIIDGIIDGCNQSGMALIGGETAQMPGMYEAGEYDLAGFAVGEVSPKNLIDGTKIEVGDKIIGIASSGVHSNGLSLVRKLISEYEIELLKEALTPTTIYSSTIKSLLSFNRDTILGIAHITGGGFSNVARINQGFDYLITPPPLTEIPGIFEIIQKRSMLEMYELYNTFNMGVGMMLVVRDETAVITYLESIGVKSWILGTVEKGAGKVLISKE